MTQSKTYQCEDSDEQIKIIFVREDDRSLTAAEIHIGGPRRWKEVAISDLKNALSLAGLAIIKTA